VTDPDSRPPDPPSGRDDEGEKIPLGQKLCDSPFILLIACIVVMFIFYTGWGLWEIASLTDAPLP